ncbi:MAG: hypothetical protein KH275_08905, partial [Clostridiales bacterium]|nr:hypothetical protein [Clostridiales bacterium]
MHTGCVSRSLAPAGLGIPLQKQRDTSRDSGRLNRYLISDISLYDMEIFRNISYNRYSQKYRES